MKILRSIKILWAIAFIIGLIAVVFRFTTGEKLTGYGSYVPWGLWVAMYFHFVGIGGGIFAIGSLGYLLNIPTFRKNYKHIIIASISAVVCGLMSIWFDLGHPFRFANIFLSPNFGSMMTFNGWMYSGFIALLALIYFLQNKKENIEQINDKSGWLVPLIMFTAVVGIAFPSQSGAFFGVVDAKPFWNSAIMPILFLTSAIIAGAAVLLMITAILENKSKPNEPPFKLLKVLIISGISAYFLMEFAEYSITFWSPNSHEQGFFLLILFGNFWWVFWLVHLFGSFLGIAILLKAKTNKSLLIAGAIITVSFISTRLNILIPGQSISEIKGLQEAYYDPKLDHFYSPTLIEYSIAIFVTSVFLELVYLGFNWIKNKH